jgi:hypothetical protein
MEAPMRNRRAPKALVQNLLTEALNYAVALQLMALTLRTLKDDRNDAVHTVAWAISGRLEKALRLLKPRKRIS